MDTGEVLLVLIVVCNSAAACSSQGSTIWDDVVFILIVNELVIVM
jgi:hypothetical protein